MINTLHIKNMGIIDDIIVDLNEGFNVLTGETGAGKSLIIGSLQILAGGRFSKEIIRHGEKYAFVEMSLYLPNQGFEDDTVIVSRELNINGKNVCKINGRLVTVCELRKFMSNVIDIHGQNDNQSLLNPGDSACDCRRKVLWDAAFHSDFYPLFRDAADNGLLRHQKVFGKIPGCARPEKGSPRNRDKLL